MYIHICVYINIYIEREREREEAVVTVLATEAIRPVSGSPVCETCSKCGDSSFCGGMTACCPRWTLITIIIIIMVIIRIIIIIIIIITYIMYLYDSRTKDSKCEVCANEVHAGWLTVLMG